MEYEGIYEGWKDLCTAVINLAYKDYIGEGIPSHKPKSRDWKEEVWLMKKQTIMEWLRSPQTHVFFNNSEVTSGEAIEAFRQRLIRSKDDLG